MSPERLEELTQQLFQLHDLNGDGFLDEAELIKLNEIIAILHQGSDANTSVVRQKYQAVFRSKLDPGGRPVPYQIFRRYAREVLEALDQDPQAQEMILEQFVAEAQSCRLLFPGAVSSPEPCALTAPASAAVGTVPCAGGGSIANGAQAPAPALRAPALGGGGGAQHPPRWTGQWPQRQPQQQPLREVLAVGYQPHPMWYACAGLPPQATPTPARSLMPIHAVYRSQ